MSCEGKGSFGGFCSKFSLLDFPLGRPWRKVFDLFVKVIRFYSADISLESYGFLTTYSVSRSKLWFTRNLQKCNGCSTVLQQMAHTAPISAATLRVSLNIGWAQGTMY